MSLVSPTATLLLEEVLTMLSAAPSALVSPIATPPLKEVVVTMLLAISIVLMSPMEMLRPVYEDARVLTGVQPWLV
jgi:hypothetical protein